MAQQVKVTLNRPAVGEILKGEAIQNLLREQTERIADDGEVEVYVAGTRAVAHAGGKNRDNEMLKRMK